MWKSMMMAVGFFIVMQLAAGDFEWAYHGQPTANSNSSDLALFDGNINFNTPSILWDASSAPLGCGLEIFFPAPVELTKAIVFTAKPNALPYAQARTEVFRFDDEKNSWIKSSTVADITGKYNDSAFTAASIRTEIDLIGLKTRQLKLLLFGSGVWMTELQLYGNLDGKEHLLLPERRVKQNFIRPQEFASGALANIDFWATERGYIGNPNALNRRDRVIFNFDLTDYLSVGKVKEAILKMSMNPFGIVDGNELVLEVCKEDRPVIAKVDVLTQNIDELARRTVESQEKSGIVWNCDVTTALNQALENGQGAILFRLRNETVEKLGNRRNSAEGVMTMPNMIQLEVKQ